MVKFSARYYVVWWRYKPNKDPEIAYFVCKISLWVFVKYIHILFIIWKSVSSCRYYETPSFENSYLTSEEKSQQIHSPEKLSKNGARIIKMLSNIKSITTWDNINTINKLTYFLLFNLIRIKQIVIEKKKILLEFNTFVNLLN